MQTSLNIGSIQIHLYGVIFALSFLIAWRLALILSKKRQIPASIIDNGLIIVILAGLIGARAYHVLDNWTFYSNNPSEMFKIWQGGIGIYGGLLASFLALIVYFKIKKIDWLSAFDAITPGVLIAQALGRWGNFFNQEAYGAPTTLPWAITIDPANRVKGYEAFSTFHPTFFYEFLIDGLAGLLLFYLSFKFPKFRGLISGLYLCLYGLGRLFVESFRIDTWGAQSGIKIATILSLIFILSGLMLLTKILILNKHTLHKA